MGDVPSSGAINGIKSLGTGCENSDRRNTPGTDISGNTSAGKILKRLRFLQDEYISYVQSHQRHLETQREESRQREEYFIKEIQSLEEEIYALASSDDTQGSSDN
jgi:hypothetical protein